MKKPLLLVGAVPILVFLIMGRADAGMITIYDTTKNPWTVSWTDPRVVEVVDTTDRTLGTPTDRTSALRKVVDFTAAGGMAPIVLTFTEVGVAAKSVGGTNGGGAASGLNFLMTNDIFNNTGVRWDTFSETLKDHDLLEEAGTLSPGLVLDTNGDDAHPSKSHFHTPVTINSSAWVLVGDPDARSDLLLKQLPGLEDTELFFTVRIHDVLVNPFQRSFTLTETPAPEPASLALLGLGLAGLGLRRRKKA